MVSLSDFYDKVKVYLDNSHSLGKRIRPLLDDVIIRLPAEEQFGMKGMIAFNTREQSVEIWDKLKSQFGMAPDLKPINRDGNCFFTISELVEDAMFYIIIIIDDLENRSDDYIKGLIAHELAEMSHPWKLTRKEIPRLRKMKPKARQIFLNKLTKQDFDANSIEYREHEIAVNNEAKRLGFEKEIETLEMESGY